MKILKYSVDDLVINPREVTKNLNKVCSARALKWSVTGVCQKGETVILILNESQTTEADYLFAKINSNSVEEIEVEIRTHWESDIHLLGIIVLNDNESVALYKRER